MEIRRKIFSCVSVGSHFYFLMGRIYLSVIACFFSLFCGRGSDSDRAKSLLWINPTVDNSVEIPDSPPIRTSAPCDISNPQGDPLFPYQWHLKNSGQAMIAPELKSGLSGEDIRVESTWEGGNYGQSVLVNVVDDGLDVDHEDLADNVPFGSINFLAGSNGYPEDNPGGNKAHHGTSVAGIIAARGGNGIGVSGVAPCARIIGNNFLLSSSVSNLTQAMTGNADVAISNNSWGSEDGTGLLHFPLQAWKDSIQSGIQDGRGGLGRIFIWAAGNGGVPAGSPPLPVDNANYDGYANHPYVISVGALTNQGSVANYSERGSSLWITTYSGFIGDTSITTTDLTGDNWGYNPGGVSPGTSTQTYPNYSNRGYTNTFNGTSASAPILSGAVALILQAYPNLTYRDIKLILARSARRMDSTDPSWVANSQGIFHSDKYGFGGLDIKEAMELAKNWSSVGNWSLEKRYSPGSGYSTGSVADGGSAGFSVSVSGSGISRLEYVEVIVDIDSSDPGKLKIELLPPHTTTPENPSLLYEPHLCYSGRNRTLPLRLCNPISDFGFGTAKYLEESADGNWTLRIQDTGSGASTELKSWRIRFYGR